MDLNDFRTILDTAGVDVWTFIDTAILVASLDHAQDLKHRRDAIVQRLYAVNRCTNCDRPNAKASASAKQIPEPETHGAPGSDDDDDDQELDPYAGLFDDEQKTILDVKERLEDPDQTEDSLICLLQSLADMDIAFQALQETDIGRHVNQLRKYPSNEVRRLVKQLVRKWKETVQQWVSVNQPGELQPSQLIADADSPQQKLPQNGHQQLPDFGYSPNLPNGSSGLENNNILDQERKPKAAPLQRKPVIASPTPQSIQRAREDKEQRESFDTDRLASARKRLQDNYKEAENAKKQRTIRVMDIHELPKPKKAFFPKNKGGASQGRYW